MKVPFVTFLPMEKELADDIRAAFERVFNRSWYISGIENENFEKAFADYCGTKYCVGVGNGLDALMLILKALGIGEGALERTVAYTQERKQFGRSISAFQNTQFQLADMATKVEAAKMLVYKAAMAKATQKVYSLEAAMAKLYAAEVAMEVTTKAVQLHGGYGYTREYDVERMMRDAKITEIYEGTSEVQRMVISANILA